MPDKRVIFAFDKKSARTLDADGRMRVKNCVLSTAEVNPYRGAEIPKNDSLGLDATKVYELYRDPKEMEKSVASFEGVPLMIKHVAQTADEPRKEYQAGSVHSISFDGKNLRGDLLVSDQMAIDMIESDELSDLSCGYRYTPVMRSGEADGVKYDGVMTAIQGNHVALVDDGRASGAHVADGAFRNPNLPDPSMQGDSKMPFGKENEHEAAPGAAETAGGANAGAPPAAAPGAGAPPAAAPAAGGGDMAAVGQALKHIAMCLERLEAKMGGGQEAAPAGLDTAGADGEMDEEGAMDEEDEGEGVDPAREQARDADLTGAEPATKDISINGGGEGGNGEGEGSPPLPNNQEGTGARGEKTPHGAMDARTVRRTVDSAVAAAIKLDRQRSAAVDEAKRAVRGVLGDVYGMDSAGAIYREALTQIGADVAAIPKGGERAAWIGYTQGAGAAAGARRAPAMAMDANGQNVTGAKLSALVSKISVKG